MKRVVIACVSTLAVIGLAAPAAADSTTIVKKRTTYETGETEPTIVLTPDGLAFGSIAETERCTTKTVKKETDDGQVTKTTKRCR